MTNTNERLIRVAEPLSAEEHREWLSLVERMPNLSDDEDTRCEELSERVIKTMPGLAAVLDHLANLPQIEEDHEII